MFYDYLQVPAHVRNQLHVLEPRAGKFEFYIVIMLEILELRSALLRCLEVSIQRFGHLAITHRPSEDALRLSLQDVFEVAIASRGCGGTIVWGSVPFGLAACCVTMVLDAVSAGASTNA